jgi:hypothetical protein
MSAHVVELMRPCEFKGKHISRHSLHTFHHVLFPPFFLHISPQPSICCAARRCIMKVSTALSLALCPLAAIAYPELQTRDNHSEPYHTDFTQGQRIQEIDASLNGSELTYTQKNGRPWFQPLGAQRAGSSGPLLLQDYHLLDTLATFNRERIPERVVHARGAGAHGYFEVTSDYASKFSVADVFKLGTKTSITMRFSTVGGARGSADQARDPRGFSIKMRTKQGILDW